MSVAIVTGSSGLIGSETARFLHEAGLDVVGIDNNMRKYFFGEDGSIDWNTKRLKSDLKRFTHVATDIRDQESIFRAFREFGSNISIVVHAAAQPSHDWAAKEPFTDFTINANGTLTLLEATRQFTPEATFIFISTNKVYGDRPNLLPLVEKEKRLELPENHPYFEHGIDESFSIDQSMHSVFGASKVAADIMVQEYGRYFGMRTGVFRGGCLTGPTHSGAELHGFLAYLVKCALLGKPYTIFGYKGKQVRDNIHSNDLVRAFWEFHQAPLPGAVFNMGGSRHSNCSVLEVIDLVKELSGRELEYRIDDKARSGDHMWWISDVRQFKAAYPRWNYQHTLESTVSEIIAAARERGGTA